MVIGVTEQETRGTRGTRGLRASVDVGTTLKAERPQNRGSIPDVGRDCLLQHSEIWAS
jgi:hypothetical protein